MFVRRLVFLAFVAVLALAGPAVSSARADENCMGGNDKDNLAAWRKEPKSNEDLYQKLCKIVGNNAPGCKVEGNPQCPANCNEFVAEALKVIFGDMKDFKRSSPEIGDKNTCEIHDFVSDSKNGWTAIGAASSQANLDMAAKKAGEGHPVIAIIDNTKKGNKDRCKNPDGHVALVLPGGLKPAGKWTEGGEAGGKTLNVPNSASAFQGKPLKRYLFCRLSAAFTEQEAPKVVLYYREKKKP